MPFRPFLKDRSTSGGLARLQDTAEASVRGTVSGTPADGVQIDDLSITTTATKHPHSLGRRPTGVIKVKDDTGLALIVSSLDSRYVTLACAAGSGTVSVWVY